MRDRKEKGDTPQPDIHWSPIPLMMMLHGEATGGGRGGAAAAAAL